jgi:hypothetical protein
LTDYLASLDFDLTGIDLFGMTREEILSAMVEAALAGADRDDLDDPDAPFAWDESLHPRDQRGRWTTSGGGGVSAEERASRRETAGKAARDFLTKSGPATKEELQALAGHLSSLTVKQLHDLRKEHGLKDPRLLKADFVTALHGYFEKVRADAATKAQAKPAEKPAQKPADPAAESRKAAVLKAAGAQAAHDGNLRDLARRGERQGTSGADAYYRGVLEAAYKGGSKPAPAPAAEKPVRVTPAAPAGAETPFRAEHFTEQAAARQMTEFIRSHIDQDVLERLNPDPGSPLDGVGQVGNQTVFPIGGKFYVVDRGKEGQKYTETLREVPAHQVEPYRRPGRLRRGSVAGFSGDAPPALRPVRFVPGKFTPARQEVAT